MNLVRKIGCLLPFGILLVIDLVFSFGCLGSNERQALMGGIRLGGSAIADKLVLVVAIHPLGGSRAHRHHMPNPQSGAARPTQDGDPQAMSNPLEYLFMISCGE